MINLFVLTVVISSQHNETVTNEELHNFIKEEVIFKIIPEELIDEKPRFY